MILFCAFISTLCFALPQDKQTSSLTTTTSVTLQNLTAQNGFVLKGIESEKEFYLPIVSAWNVNNISLHLLVSHNDSTSKHVTVTAVINGYPISSLNLVNGNASIVNWDISIPKQYIKGALLTVVFKRNTDIEGISCISASDTGSWVAFAPDSTISYQYTYKEYVPNLSLFPLPFINQSSITKDNVVIVLPEQFDKNELESAYYVANALYIRKTWRGVDLTGLTSDNLANQVKAASNIIMIGVASKIKPLLAADLSPLKMNNDGYLTDANNKVIDDETGVVIALTSPWNSHNAILVVTGNSTNSVIKAAQALREKEFNNLVLFDKYAFVNSLPKFNEKKIDWTDTHFDDLGYKNEVVYGGGENSIKYTVNLPANQLPVGMDVDLHYAVSPLLSGRDASFVSVKANELPVTGEHITTSDSNNKRWRFHINGENLKPGKNEITFNFDLKYHNKYCTSDDLTLAWAVIYADSALKVKFDKNDISLTFSDFNVVDQDISVFIPKIEPIFKQQPLLNFILNMARNISRINQFEIYYGDADIASASQKSNIIYIGNMADSQTLNALRHHFPFCYFDNKVMIKQSIMPYFHLSDETPEALLELIKSPYDDAHQFLLVTANNINGYQLAIDTLFNPSRNQYLQGNTALIYEDGTFTSVDTNRLELKASNDAVIKDVKRSVFIGFSIFVVIFFGGLVVLIIYRRARRYFSRNVDHEE